MRHRGEMLRRADWILLYIQRLIYECIMQMRKMRNHSIARCILPLKNSRGIPFRVFYAHCIQTKFAIYAMASRPLVLNAHKSVDKRRSDQNIKYIRYTRRQINPLQDVWSQRLIPASNNVEFARALCIESK